MGMRKEHLEYIFGMFEHTGYKQFDGMKMCELGNQRIGDTGRKYLEDNDIPSVETGKELFTHIGFKHTSIDINGEDGALPIDLTKPIIGNHPLPSFDIITNFGTSEHVPDQYQCFKNMHNMCKNNGLFISVVPALGYINTMTNTETSKKFVTLHGLYNYTFEFFRDLADLCKYEILDERIIRHSTAVTMRKTTDEAFISAEKFDKLQIYAVTYIK